MEIINNIITVISMFITIIIFDYIWLGIITKNFIISQFGSLVKVVEGSISIKLGIGLLAWFIIALGVFIFAVYKSVSVSQAMLLGTIFGFISYSIYDLTNLTFIKNYPVKFVFVDIMWGSFLGFILSTVGFMLKSSLNKVI